MADMRVEEARQIFGVSPGSGCRIWPGPGMRVCAAGIEDLRHAGGHLVAGAGQDGGQLGRDLRGVAGQQQPGAGFPARLEQPGPDARPEPVGAQHHQFPGLAGHHPCGHGPPGGRRPGELPGLRPVHRPAQRARHAVGEGLQAACAGGGDSIGSRRSTR